MVGEPFHIGPMQRIRRIEAIQEYLRRKALETSERQSDCVQRAEAGIGDQKDPVRVQTPHEICAIAVVGKRRSNAPDGLNEGDVDSRRPSDLADEFLQLDARTP